MTDAHEDGVTRREFTAATVMAMLAGVVVTITASGCGGGGSSPTSPGSVPTVESGDKQGVISANHGHIAVIKSAQLTAGGAVTLQIQGTADHNHSVDFSTDDIHAIAGGTRISRDSSTNQGHNHTVTFN